MVSRCILLLILLYSSVGVMRGKDLLTEIMYSGIFSLTLVLLYLAVSAPDVALTEAAVGSYLVGILIFWSGILTHDTEDHFENPKKLPTLSVVCLFGVVIIFYAALYFPLYGVPQSSLVYEAHKYYLAEATQLFGFPNVVTAILAGFRGYDTLIETTVVFAAVVSVFFISTKKTHKSEK